MNSFFALKSMTAVPRGEPHDKLGHFSKKTSQDFAEQLWPGVEASETEHTLLRHHYRCCTHAFSNPWVVAVAQRKNDDILCIADIIKGDNIWDEVLQSVIEFAHRDHANDVCHVEDLDVAKHWLAITQKISLMCNVEVGAVRPQDTDLDQKHVSRNQGDIRLLLHDAFPKANKLGGRGSLARTFHARNLERFRSIPIMWTNNLLDHLRIHDPSTDHTRFRVSIFHHARFLRHC